MIHNDVTYWKAQTLEWINKAEEYLAYGDEEGFERCMAQSNKAQLYLDESRGLVTVVSGRKGFGASMDNPNVVFAREYTYDEKEGLKTRLGWG